MTKDELIELAREGMEMHSPKAPEYIVCAALIEALTQPEHWEKFCDSNCVWTDHHPDCKLAEQEPVAWRYKILDYFGRPVWTFKTPKTDIRVFESQPLYTSPPQRKPLTDEEIADLYFDKFSIGELKAFVRAIEAKHGIKAKA